MSVLVDRDIEAEWNKGNIIISPFKQENLSPNSYDVSLGEFYFRSIHYRNLIKDKKVNKDEDFILDPWNEESVKHYWGKSQYAERDEKGRLFILMHPMERILGHTQEFIGGRNNITTMMKTRSSLGRSNLDFLLSSGWGDVNYTNRWTMEITNFSHNPVKLYVGERVAQICFLYTSNVPRNPYKGKYQKEDDINELMANWRPEQMLPRLYLDK